MQLPSRVAAFAQVCALGAALALGALAGCSSSPAPALIVRPGATPAPIEHTRADPVQRSDYHWFGEVPMGEVVRHTFVLDNTSQRTVSIVRALPSCNCLKLEVRAKDASGAVVGQLHDGGSRTADVPPGGTLEVEFVVDTREERGPNSPRLLQASVHTGDPSVPRIALEGTVIATSPFVLPRGEFNIGIVAAEAPATERLTLAQSGTSGTVLTEAVVACPADWIVRVFEDRSAPTAVRVWTLQVTVPAGPEGRFDGRIELATADASGAAGAPFVVPVRGARGPTVYAAQNSVFFRAGATTTTLRVSSRLPADDARIASVTVDGPLAGHLTHTVTPGAGVTTKGPSWTIDLAIEGDAPAECSGRLTVAFENERWPPLVVPYLRFP
jgi:hypothetical protein